MSNDTPNRSSSTVEEVVLLDEGGQAIGVADKAGVHGPDTPLHLAFSCYVFDDQNRLLITRRALHKKTWPGVWTNSCCGHPAPGEPFVEAVRRRTGQELGITLTDLRLISPRFRYRVAMDDGTMENEMCPVFVATTADEVRPDPTEVASHEWVPWAEFREDVLARRAAVSPWCVSQVAVLPKRPYDAPAADDALLPPAARPPSGLNGLGVTLRLATLDDVEFLTEVLIGAARAQGRQTPDHGAGRAAPDLRATPDHGTSQVNGVGPANPVSRDSDDDYRTGLSHWTRQQVADTDPSSSTYVVLRDREPIGRLRVIRHGDTVELAGIQLSPEHQGSGFGTAVVRALQDEGGEVTLGVEKDNPRARALYERLGFVTVGQDEENHLMRWQRRRRRPDSPRPSG